MRLKVDLDHGWLPRQFGERGTWIVQWWVEPARALVENKERWSEHRRSPGGPSAPGLGRLVSCEVWLDGHRSEEFFNAERARHRGWAEGESFPIMNALSGRRGPELGAVADDCVNVIGRAYCADVRLRAVRESERVVRLVLGGSFSRNEGRERSLREALGTLGVARAARTLFWSAYREWQRRRPARVRRLLRRYTALDAELNALGIDATTRLVGVHRGV